MIEPRASLIVLRARDVERTLAFYEALGLRFVQEKHGSGPIHFSSTLGSTVVELYPASKDVEPDRRAPGATMVGFTVESLDRALAAAGRMGANLDRAEGGCGETGRGGRPRRESGRDHAGTSRVTSPKFERVYTVHDFYDGARRGFADFDGRPHAYRAVLRYNKGVPEDDYYDLSPIDPSSLPLVLEEWDIWRRWEAAFKAGKATVDSHPALPEDRARYEAVHPLVRRCLAVLARRAIRVRGTFRRMADAQGVGVNWERIAQPRRARRESL